MYVCCIKETNQTPVFWDVIITKIMQIPAIIFHGLHDSLESLKIRFVFKEHEREKRARATCFRHTHETIAVAEH